MRSDTTYWTTDLGGPLHIGLSRAVMCKVAQTKSSQLMHLPNTIWLSASTVLLQTLNRKYYVILWKIWAESPSGNSLNFPGASELRTSSWEESSTELKCLHNLRCGTSVTSEERKGIGRIRANRTPKAWQGKIAKALAEYEQNKTHSSQALSKKNKEGTTDGLQPTRNCSSLLLYGYTLAGT